MTDVLFGALTAKEDKLNEVRVSAPFGLSTGSYLSFTALNSILLLIWHYIIYLMFVSAAKSLEKFTVQFGSFTQEFSLSIYLKQLIFLPLFWIILFLIIYGISRFLGGTAPIKSFFCYSGFMYPFSSLFLTLLPLMGLVFYISNVPLIFICFILFIVLFIFFLRNLVQGIRIIQNISKGAAFISVIVSVLILGGVLWLVKGMLF